MYYIANGLSTVKQITAIAALAEGSSIRTIEGMTGIHRETIMWLNVHVGQGCGALLYGKVRNLSCDDLQLEQISGFVGKKERHVRLGGDPQYQDAWTFYAIRFETKAVS